MPITTVEVIEGGQKGQKVALATKLAVDKFFSLGVTKIQNECNNVARRYCALWNAKSSELMSEYHFQITYTQGRNEIQQDFVLFEPSTIRINVFNSYCPSNPSIAANVVHSRDNPMNPTITIYLDALEVSDSAINWIGFSASFESIIYHELLHACGDSPVLRNEVHDGVIRHTLVCSEAINNLCN